jgi:hypothetical protein
VRGHVESLNPSPFPFLNRGESGHPEHDPEKRLPVFRKIMLH